MGLELQNGLFCLLHFLLPDSQTAREKPGKLEARSENLDILVFGKYVFHHTDAQIKEFKTGEILCGVSQNGNRKF